MRVDNLVPEVYYRESRDFAYIGRLIEIVLNYMKTAADCVNINIDNENVDANIVELLVDTLGFELRHAYVNKDLIGISSAFSSLLKYKGSTSAIELAVRLLLNSQGIKNQADFDFCIFDPERAEVQINIPDALSDIILLEDLFDYILPVGVTYKFTKFSNNNNKKQSAIHPVAILQNTTDKNTAGSADSAYVFDSNIGVIKSDASEMGHIGGFYTGVVATDIRDPEVIKNEALEHSASTKKEGD